MSKRSVRIVIGVASMILLQVLAIALYRGIEEERQADPQKQFRFETLRLGIPLPDILLEREDGTRISLRALGNDVRLVHFWATWCPPCVDELPGLLSTARELSPKGLTLVAISMDEDWDSIRAFFADKIPSEIYRAVDVDAYHEFDIATLPDTYLSSRNHRLRLRYGGARDWMSPVAREHLSAQLEMN